MLATIWWAETASGPKRATKIAISVKLETSKKVLRPIGMPTWSCSFISAHLGPKMRSACIVR